MALLRCTWMPVTCDTSRLVGQSRRVLMPVGQVEVSRARVLHGHDDFFQGAVAGPFAEAVDGAFDLAGPFLHGGQAVGHGQAQVVVAMDAEDDLVDAAARFSSDGEWSPAYCSGTA